MGGDRTITQEMVWEAYRALHRYVVAGPIVKGAKPPKRVPQYPVKNNVPVCDTLAKLVTKLYNGDTPLIVSPAYFTYLYLFVQLLRCSSKAEPMYVEGRGWMNLGWFPLHSLHGRDINGQPQAAIRFWRWWVTRHSFPRTAEEDLLAVYPWFEDDVSVSMSAVDNQLRIVIGLALRTASDPTTVLRNLTPTGHPRDPRKASGWHPMFLLARADTWTPDPENPRSLVEQDFATVRPYLLAILNDRKLGDTFVKKFIPAANLDNPTKLKEHLEIVRDGLDDVVGKMLSKHHRLWELLRKRAFPADREQPC